MQSDEWLRNYLESGNIKWLSDYFDLTVLIDEKIDGFTRYAHNHSSFANIENFNIALYRKTGVNISAHMKLADELLWINRHKSTSYKYRLKRKYLLTSELYNVCLSLQYQYLNKETTTSLVSKFDRLCKPALDLEDSILQTEPKFILLPSANYEAVTNEILRSTRLRECSSTILAIDNWDNLCSKTVIAWMPDYITCMGPQQAAFCRDIHDINMNRVYSIGTPRFDIYRSEIMNSINKCSATYNVGGQSVKILYLGSSQPNNEVTILQTIDCFLHQDINRINKYQVVYKPHPSRRFTYNDIASIKSLETIEILPESMDGMLNQSDLDLFTTLEANCKLFVDADIFICGPTTMLLEALLCKKTVLLMVDQSQSISSNQILFNQLMHFRGISNHPGVKLIYNLDQLCDQILSADLRKDSLEVFQSHKHIIDYYVTLDRRQWAERLFDDVLKLT